MASGFGIAAGIFAVFFFGEIPRIRKDILMSIPVIGGYWERTIAPEDNVRWIYRLPFPIFFSAGPLLMEI